MQTTRQRLKFLFLFLVAFTLVIVATSSYFGSHFLTIKSSESSMIRGVTEVEERHYYNIHSWQGKPCFKIVCQLYACAVLISGEVVPPSANTDSVLEDGIEFKRGYSQTPVFSVCQLFGVSNC